MSRSGLGSLLCCWYCDISRTTPQVTTTTSGVIEPHNKGFANVQHISETTETISGPAVGVTEI